MSRMSREDYAQKVIPVKVGVKIEELRAIGLDVVVCGCGNASCDGWILGDRDMVAREMIGDREREPH